MLIWAVMSHLPYCLLGHDYGLNVLVTLLRILVAVYLLDKKGWFLYFLAFAVFLPVSLFSDWAFLPLVFTMIFYEVDKHDRKWLPIILLPIVMFVARLLISNDFITRCILEAVAFIIITAVIYLLRGITDRKVKGAIPGFVFYAYYPLHLFIIVLDVQSKS